jgi:hypothetical protein
MGGGRGALIGAMKARKKERLRGAGYGAGIGAGTELGAGLGAGAGALAGFLGGPLAPLTVPLGALGGAGLGGYGGYKATKGIMEDIGEDSPRGMPWGPAPDKEEESEEEAPKEEAKEVPKEASANMLDAIDLTVKQGYWKDGVHYSHKTGKPTGKKKEKKAAGGVGQFAKDYLRFAGEGPIGAAAKGLRSAATGVGRHAAQMGQGMAAPFQSVPQSRTTKDIGNAAKAFMGGGVLSPAGGARARSAAKVPTALEKQQSDKRAKCKDKNKPKMAVHYSETKKAAVQLLDAGTLLLKGAAAPPGTAAGGAIGDPSQMQSALRAGTYKPGQAPVPYRRRWYGGYQNLADPTAASQQSWHWNRLSAPEQQRLLAARKQYHAHRNWATTGQAAGQKTQPPAASTMYPQIGAGVEKLTNPQWTQLTGRRR